MAQAKYLSEPTNFCPNCGAFVMELIKMEMVARFYQKKNQNIAIHLPVKVEEGFETKIVGHKTTTVTIQMKAKKSKPIKRTKMKKIIRKIPIFVAKCGLCVGIVNEDKLNQLFKLKMVDGKLSQLEEPAEEPKTEPKEAPPAE